MSDKKKFGAANDKPRVVSLRDLQGNNNNSCSSDEDEKQTYYAGGEKSGVAISGGKKDMKAAHDIMSGIFSKASSEDPSKAKKPDYSFAGSGKKLNGSFISPGGSKSTPKDEDDEPEIVTVDLIFWSDGFTISQGPLQSYTEPEGLKLLERIKNGNVTADDLGINPFEMADVRISQLPSEAFNPARRNQIMKGPGGGGSSEPARPTFTGTGEKVGGSSDDSKESVVSIDESAQLEDSITTTRIQIVLPNGSRKVLTISPRSKVSELYAQIVKETGLSAFKLKVGNPAKSIPESLDAQLYQIGLVNSSIIISPINN